MPLENFIQDLRYGVRMLRRNPLFAGAAVITLGLGLGATLAVFNVVNGVLLRPLPYRDPERINIIWFAWRGDDGNVWKLPLSSGSYSDIERDSRSFEALAAFRAWPYAIAESPEAEREAVAGGKGVTGALRRAGCLASGWSRIHARRGCAGWTAGRADQPRPLATQVRRQSRHRRKADLPRRRSLYPHRSDAARFRFSARGGASRAIPVRPSHRCVDSARVRRVGCTQLRRPEPRGHRQTAGTVREWRVLGVRGASRAHRVAQTQHSRERSVEIGLQACVDGGSGG